MPKKDADAAFDAAACIGCGACVAACPNASAMLFTAAKVTHLGLLPQGQPERNDRVVNMVAQQDDEGFGGCTNIGECSAACPKGISMETISRLNHDLLGALRAGARPKEPTPPARDGGPHRGIGGGLSRVRRRGQGRRGPALRGKADGHVTAGHGAPDPGAASPPFPPPPRARGAPPTLRTGPRHHTPCAAGQLFGADPCAQGAEQVVVEPGDRLHRDALGAHRLALADVGAAAEALGVLLGDHVEHAGRRARAGPGAAGRGG